MLIYSLPVTAIHLVNIVTQVLFDYFLVQLLGPRALAYFILSSFLAGSLHPCAGHFIAEHYIFERSKVNSSKSTSGSNLQHVVPPLETYSYYGPLNLLTYNVGLHNEHHDFPAVPWSRLPALHDMAKEFYSPLPSHKSWTWVIWQFIWDQEVGLWCRLKRKEGGRKVGDSWRVQDLGLNEGTSIIGVK